MSRGQERYVLILNSSVMFRGFCSEYLLHAYMQKTVRGIIKGTGYLCGCNDCKLSKARSFSVLLYVLGNSAKILPQNFMSKGALMFFTQNLNAFEFERHAACKTKHPNNHIYFENGKTIYAVVQELKNTPQEKLFEAIQNITGSPINQKNFQTWKGEYSVSP